MTLSRGRHSARFRSEEGGLPAASPVLRKYMDEIRVTVLTSTPPKRETRTQARHHEERRSSAQVVQVADRLDPALGVCRPPHNIGSCYGSHGLTLRNSRRLWGQVLGTGLERLGVSQGISRTRREGRPKGITTPKQGAKRAETDQPPKAPASMARRGSTVRVRQRASRKRLQMGRLSCPPRKKTVTGGHPRALSCVPSRFENGQAA